MEGSNTSTAKKGLLAGLGASVGIVIGFIVVIFICCFSCILLVALSDTTGKDSNSEVIDESEETSDEPNDDTAEESPKEEKQEEVMKVDIQAFINEFDSNQLAAEKKYKGKMVEFTGYVDNISEDILGTPYASVNPTNDEYYFDTSIQCRAESKDSLLKLTNGGKFTFRGKVDTQSIGIILVDDCKPV